MTAAITEVQPSRTPTTNPPPITDTVAERGTTLRRRAAAGCFFGASGISLAGFLATPFEGKSGESVYLHSLAAHPKQVPAQGSPLRRHRSRRSRRRGR